MIAATPDLPANLPICLKVLMNANAKHPKREIYRVLRHLPGRPGAIFRNRYSRKLERDAAREEFQRAIRRIDGTVCIDLGANVGKYTRLLAARARHVIAFEPDPWTCARLRENVAGLDNVQVENAAVGTSDGVTLLYRHRRFDGNRAFRSQSSSTLSTSRRVDTDSPLEVRLVDFVKYLEGLGDTIGILKIDIEGAEIELLETLFDRPDLLGRMDYIFAETHERFHASYVPRVARLRERAELIHRPVINLGWH